MFDKMDSQANQEILKSRNNRSVFRRPIRAQKQIPSHYPPSALSFESYDDDESLKSDRRMDSKEDYSFSDLDEAVQLKMRIKREKVQTNQFSAQTFPMLVSLEVENLKENSEKAALDLVCVIDQSISMHGSPIDLVKKALRCLLNYLGDSDRLSVVIFNDSATRIFPLTTMTQANKDKTSSQIQLIDANNGTNIHQGICHAFKILQERKQVNAVSSIFLLSDGLDDYTTKNGVSASLNDYEIPENVTIHTFGFGNDHDPLLMNDIANLRDGNFYFIEKLDTIDEAFVDCLGGLLSSVGQNVVVKIKPAQSEHFEGAVEIMKAYGSDLKMWDVVDGDIYYTKIRNLISGQQKDYVLEIKIPPVIISEKECLNQKIKVADAEVQIVTLNNQQKIVKKAELWITYTNSEFYEEDDREVMKNFYRVKCALVINEARKLADHAEYEEAKKLLENFNEELENSFLRSEEFLKNLMKDIAQAIQDTDPWIYCEKGRHSLFENSRAQMTQKTNFKSSINYQNSLQKEMTSQLRMTKSERK